VVVEQSFSSKDQLAGEAAVRHDADSLTSMTVAGVEANKTRQVKLCCVSRTFDNICLYISYVYAGCDVKTISYNWLYMF